MGMEGNQRVYRRSLEAEQERENERRAQEYLAQKEAEKEVERLDRRALLTGFVGVGAVAALGGVNKLAEPWKRVDERHKHHHRHRIAAEIEASPGAETFEMGELTGMRVGGLETDFLGVHSGKLPEKLDIDYSANLTRMWKKKIDTWEPKLEKRGKHIDINVLQMQSERTSNYEARWNSPWRAKEVARTTLKEATQEIDLMVDGLKGAINVDALAKLYHLSPEQLPVVGKLAVSIDWKGVDAEGMLAAYSMTELLPKWDGDANAHFYDFLLQTAGKEFLANIPSMGDPATSFGPLQFTSEALEDSIDRHTGKHERHGASVANQLLPKHLQLPPSLDRVHDFVEHFKAGYLFALNNLASFTRSVHNPDTLKRLSGLDKSTLLAFLSASHNNPSLARRSLELYLALPSGKHGPDVFVTCCEAIDDEHVNALMKSGRHYNALVRISDYAQKTIANFKGLQDYLQS